MKRAAAIVFLFSLTGLIFLSFQVRQVKQAELQAGYQKYVDAVSGAKLDIFSNRKFLGVPHSSHQVPILDLSNASFPPFQKENFSANIQAFLNVPRSGVYSLELASDDGALLYLDEKLVIDNNGFHAYQSKKRKYFLSKGFHYLFLRYRNEKGEARLRLTWAPKGKMRQPIGGDDLFLPKNVPVRTHPLPGLFSQKILQLNQLRFALLLLMGVSLFLFVKRKISFSLQGGAALALFALAFLLQYVYYLDHLELRIQGIMDGGDFLYFLLLPLRWLSHGEFISLQCGNLPLLIPLLGVIYHFFHFFPGVHYYALLMMGCGALICLFPWFLFRRGAPGWIGLIAGIFLAVNPLLVEHHFPYVTSDLLGYFTFSAAIFFSIQALRKETWGYYLLAGAALALLPLSRTVYIPAAPVFMFCLILLAKNKKRALCGGLIFASILFGYDWLARLITQNSYFMYYIKDGLKATVHHRVGDQPAEWWHLFFWLPKYLPSYFVLLFQKLCLFPFQWSALVCFGVSLLLLARYQFRQFLFLSVVCGLYLFEISSYTVFERYTLPLVFVMGMILALGFASGLRFLSPKAQIYVTASLCCLFFLSGVGYLGTQVYGHTRHQKKQSRFFQWVKAELPPKSIILTDQQIDPWMVFEQTGRPVFYEATMDQTFVVNRSVVPVTQITFLRDQSQIPHLPLLRKPRSNTDFFRDHPYVLDGLTQLGYRYFIIQKSFAQRLVDFYFQHSKEMSLNARHYQVEPFKVYPQDGGEGIWEVKRTKIPVKQPVPFKPPAIPSNLDRFLK